jgi:hypothetical protein
MKVLARMIRRWRAWLVAAGIAVAALLAAFTPAPPSLAPSHRPIYAVLASAALSAAVLLPLATGRARAQRAIAIAAAATLLVLGLAANYYSHAVQRQCTVAYNGRPVIVGTELTALGAQWKRQRPDDTAADVLFDSSGDPSHAWTRDSIDRCRGRIAGTYFLWIPLLVSSLVCGALAVPGSKLSVPAIAPVKSSPAATVPVRYDLFISYRHGGADGDIAARLLQTLEADGYAVAIDERDFPANASFLQEMERCIRESRYTVAIVSARYLESGNCEEEAIISKVLDMSERRRRLIPFVIQSTPSGMMPAWLFGIVGIDCTRPDPLVDPVEKLKATLGPPMARPSDAAV